MPTEYDPRRPRIPVSLAQAIDGARGQVPFNRWVVGALEAALGNTERSQAFEPKAVRVSPASPRAPGSRPYVCPVPGCGWKGTGIKDGTCPEHWEKVVPR